METKSIDRLVIGVRDLEKATRLLSKLLGIEFKEVTNREVLEAANVKMCVGHIPQARDRIHLEVIQPLQPVKDLKPPFTLEMAESLKHAEATVHAVLFRTDDARQLQEDLGKEGIRIFKTIERATTVVGGSGLVEVVTDPEDTLDIRMAFMEYRDVAPQGGEPHAGERREEENPVTPGQGKSVVAEFIARIDAALHGRPADPYELLADDAVVIVNGTTPLSGAYFGQDEIRKVLVAAAALRIRSGEVAILDSIAQGERIGVFLKIRATSHSGKTYNAAGDPAGCYFKLRGGKIREVRFYPDTTQIETQIYGRAFVPNKANASDAEEARP